MLIILKQEEKRWKMIESEVLKDFQKLSSIIEEKQQKIVDLEAKLEKKEFAINNYWKSEKNKKEMFREENKQLKQQLAEKDQAIESLQEINQSLGQTCNNDAKEIERLREQLHTANQETLHFQNKYFAEKQIAIEELDKVKQQLFKNFDGIGFNTYCEKVKPVESYINQQIKSLKGEKENV